MHGWLSWHLSSFDGNDTGSNIVNIYFSFDFCIIFYTKFVLYILINFFIKYKTLWSSV